MMEFNANGIIIDIEDVIEIAALAATAIKEAYNTDVENWTSKFKNDESPLTIAQEMAINIIETALRSKYPSIPILAESIALDDNERSQTVIFCVSPLDGYKDFVRRNGQFSVSIGLCEMCEPVLGVVYVPCSTMAPPRVYYAVEGKGAYVRNLHPSENMQSAVDDGHRRPSLSVLLPTRLEAKPFYETDPALRILAHTPSFGADSIKAFLNSYESPEIISSPGFSLLSLMLIAEGRAHVLPRLASTCEWNTCGAHAIINEAGGELLQVTGGAIANTGAQLEYNKPHPLNPHFIAYGKRLVVSPCISPSGGLRSLFAAVPHEAEEQLLCNTGPPATVSTVMRHMLANGDGRAGCIGSGVYSQPSVESDGDEEVCESVQDHPARLFSSSPSSSLSSLGSKCSTEIGGGSEASESLVEKLEVEGVRHPGEYGYDVVTPAGDEMDEGRYTNIDKDSKPSASKTENEDKAVVEGRSQLYNSMMFSFLSAVFVVLVGWVLLGPPDYITGE